MDHGTEISFDLSGEIGPDPIPQHSIYGSCWREANAETVGECRPTYAPDAPFENLEFCSEVDDASKENVTFVQYKGSTGVTLFNKRRSSSATKFGCLTRKSRVPVDLSKIGRMELDIQTSPKGCCGNKAPFYSVWLSPMNYSDVGDNAKAAEIDLIENYEQNGRTRDVNSVKTNFAQCGDIDYTRPYCHNINWNVDATSIDHHVTLKAVDGPDGKEFHVYHCNAGVDTCPDSGDSAWIKVQKPTPPNVDPNKWFPIWNKDLVGANYAHYFIQIDQWWTSNTDFQLGVDNFKFYHNDGSEWTMPLDYGPDNDLGVYSQNHQSRVQSSPPSLFV